MTPLSDEALPARQREVQRLLGRCLLRLQQYERLIKAIVAHHELTGPPHALETIRAARVADSARKTLGTLIGDLLGSYLAPNEIGDTPKDLPDCPAEPVMVSFRIGLSLSDADFARLENELRELVALRNDLVHHFIDRHDLWSVDGCLRASDALVAAYSRIDQYFEQLRGWAEHMEQTRRLAAEFAQSDAFRDLIVNGIAPDSTVFGQLQASSAPCGRPPVNWPSMDGHPLRRQEGGLPSGSRNNSLRNTGAAVGGRLCINRKSSIFGTSRSTGSVRPDTGKKKAPRTQAEIGLRGGSPERQVPGKVSLPSAFPKVSPNPARYFTIRYFGLCRGRD